MAGPEAAYKYKTGLYLAASASAEFLADIALCPFEAIKVRMQGAITAPYKGTFDGFSKITAAEGVGGLYKGLYPLWGRQIPYTMMKFASFENIVEMIYRRLPGRKEDYGKAAQTGVSFVGGYLAGILCAVVSHPADVMVSKLNAYRKPGEPFGAVTTRIYKDIGFMGLWNGLAVRIFMIGTLTGLQWMIYVSATDHVLGRGGGGTGTDRDKQWTGTGAEMLTPSTGLLQDLLWPAHDRRSSAARQKGRVIPGSSSSGRFRFALAIRAGEEFGDGASLLETPAVIFVCTCHFVTFFFPSSTFRGWKQKDGLVFATAG